MKKISILVSVILCVGFSAQAAILFSDTFDYPDGNLVNVSDETWATHSGTAGEQNVVNGKLQLTQSEGEDTNADLEGAPYTTGFVYFGLDVVFTALPLPISSAQRYFAHLKTASAGGFAARVHVVTFGAPEGFFRFGISNGSNNDEPVVESTDRSLLTTYRVVVSYDIATNTPTLYIDPTLESGGISDTTATNLYAIREFAFRQSVAGTGDLTADNLVVATTFEEAATITPVPEPSTYAMYAVLGGVAGFVFLRNRRTVR